MSNKTYFLQSIVIFICCLYVLNINETLKYNKSEIYLDIFIFISLFLLYLYNSNNILYLNLWFNINKSLIKWKNWILYIKYLKFNVPNNSNPYLYAAMNGKLEIMKYLEKEHNWSPHVKNNCGNDAYLIASCYGCLEIMKYLEKEHNWDIHVKNNNGNDAYLLASCNGKLEVMKYLEKEHNWDIHVKNNYGGDAYLLASCCGQLEIMKYLEKEHSLSFICPFGLSLYKPEKGEPSYSLPMIMKSSLDSENTLVEQFFNELHALDEFMIAYGVKYSKQIFNKEYSREIVQANYSELVKESVNKVTDEKYPPKISPKKLKLMKYLEK